MIFVYRTSMVGPSGMPLSDYAEGDLIKLNEGGSPVEFYVSKHDYEPDLNGAGRTLVVRKDVYDNRAWDNGNVNAYASSDLDAWFNGTYKALLDPSIQTAIGTTKFYYTPGRGNWSVSTLERAVFALSLSELGIYRSYVNAEGSALPIYSALNIAYQNGSAIRQWTRTPRKNYAHESYFVGITGLESGFNCNEVFGSRPIFTLPSTILINPDTNEVVA